MALISKRIRTEPDENRDFIAHRLTEIRNKYNSKRDTREISREVSRDAALGEISCEGLRNINHLKIREVDSPISCLQKSFARDVGYFSNKEIGMEARRFGEHKVDLRAEEADPRINNIEKINQKIRHILRDIETKKD